MPPRKKARAAPAAAAAPSAPAAAVAAAKAVTSGGDKAAAAKPKGDPFEIERSRLLTRDTVFLGRSTKKALLKFQAFAATVGELGEDARDDPGVKRAADATLRELRLLAIEVKKAALSEKACARELAECAELETATTAEIAESEATIAALQEQLARERKVRERKEEYEAMAKIINVLPSKKSSRAAIDVLSADVAALEAQQAELDDEMERRSRKFELLLQTIDDLQRSDLEEYDEREARAERAAEDRAWAEKEAAEAAEAAGEGDGSRPPSPRPDTPSAVDAMDEDEEAGEIKDDDEPSSSRKRSRDDADAAAAAAE